MNEYWTIEFKGQARKVARSRVKYLSDNAAMSYAILLTELRKLGPIRSNWPHFTVMKKSYEDYHCHLNKGRPTYVVCWRVVDKKVKLIEVYYAGTHENAPY